MRGFFLGLATPGMLTPTLRRDTLVYVVAYRNPSRPHRRTSVALDYGWCLTYCKQRQLSPENFRKLVQQAAAEACLTSSHGELAATVIQRLTGC